MRIAVVGAGAMGGSYGGLLARAGHEVTLIDTRADHVEAINREGLRLEGARGEHVMQLAAEVTPSRTGFAEVAIVFVDSNSTGEAAETAAEVLAPDGFAITFQNGIGNVETLQAALGRERVLGGSSMCSAAVRGPGHVALTHHAATSLGETDGRESERARAVAAALNEAGLETKIAPDVNSTNSGPRPRRDLVVVAGRGIRTTDPDLRATVKKHCRSKFSRPSMLQHVGAGRRKEIDALNGALVREARAL